MPPSSLMGFWVCRVQKVRPTASPSVNLRWGDIESHSLNCLTWETSQLKSCCPQRLGYVRHAELLLRNLHVAHYVGPMCLHDPMVRHLHVAHDVGQMKVFLTTWCHLGHMLVTFSAPMFAMGTPASYQVWWACLLDIDSGIHPLYLSPWRKE